MNARSQPPVEPLSRPAWDRVEARLFESLERGEHLALPSPAPLQHAPARIWVGVAALAAAAMLLLWWRFEPVAPEAVTNAGRSEPAELEASRTRAPRPETTHIVTTGAPTRTTIGEATLTLAAASEVHVSGSDADGWLVRLGAGEVDCEVAPRNGRPPFVVQAGETQVTVIGTRFIVRREGFGAHVSVLEGQVQVASGATQLSIGPGEEWSAPPAADEPVELDEPVVEPVDRHGKRPKAARPARERLSSSERFERAAGLEASDPEAALTLYRGLATGRGHWAANALYAQARLEFERGRQARAKPLLQRYLQRYPAGLNVADVRSLLSRIPEAGIQKAK